MQTHELHLDIINDKLCSRKKKINYQAYINNITQKKREILILFCLLLYTQNLAENMHTVNSSQINHSNIVWDTQNIRTKNGSE